MNICCTILLLLIISLIVLITLFFFTHVSKKKISDLTDEWINQVTVKHDPKAIANMFCSNGSLVGTVSQNIRTGAAIEDYFDYFAKLPDITVTNKDYTISRLSNNIMLNTAFITWTWDKQKPLTARMSFLFKNNCIFQLHSSALPEKSKGLKGTY